MQDDRNTVETEELEPHNGDDYRDRDIIYQNKSDADNAIANFTQAIKLYLISTAEAYRLRGDSYRNKSNYDRAIADCTKALELNPDFTLAYHTRWQAYEAQGDRVRGYADFLRAGIVP